MKKTIYIVVLAFTVFFTIATNLLWAHQPVMDMAPRWQNGYGFQLRQEFVSSDTLLNGNSEIHNPLGRDREVNTTWLEGIYTYKREVRFTVKIPYVDQRRTIVHNDNAIVQSGSGFGDIIFGVPLKRYSNEATATSNIAFTPSIRLPTGSTAGDFPVSDGSTDLGASFSASFEKANLYQYYDLYYWKNGDGKRGIKEGNEIGLDINIGWHPYHNNLKNRGVFLMMDASLRYQEKGRSLEGITGGKRLTMGPVFVYYQGGIMLRAEYKYPVYEDITDVQISRGKEFSVGIGFVF